MYRLLIVDDEHHICEGLKVLIDWCKYDIKYIETAVSYSEAIEKGIEFRPDIAILDVCLNGFRGHQIIDKFTSLGIDCKFIMISGYDDFEFVRDAIRPDVRDYILKPIGKRELEEVVRKILHEDFGEDLSDGDNNDIDPISGKNYSELSGIVNKILSNIEENYGQNIKLKRIGERFKMNSAYLGQLFTKETGMKFSEYLKVYRLLKAKEMIENTSDKISYIATKVGYSNINYFYIHFKEYFDLTPTELREDLNIISEESSRAK